MAPMCQYSVTAKDGRPNDWHFVHYVSRAVGGTGLIIMEMTDVEPDGRITDFDLGLWSDDQIPAFARIISEVKRYGAKIGVQIAHTGRKAKDAETPVAPSAIPYDSDSKNPRALTTSEVGLMVEKFRARPVGRSKPASTRSSSTARTGTSSTSFIHRLPTGALTCTARIGQGSGSK